MRYGCLGMGSLALLTGLAGCTTQTRTRPGEPPPVTTAEPAPEMAPPPSSSGATGQPLVVLGTGQDSDGGSQGLILLTPASRLETAAATTYIPGDTYTRVIITARDASLNGREDDPEIYPYKKRSPVERFFVGTRHSATLTAKVNSGPFTATVPLLTVSHDSTRREGEVFDRTIRHEASSFPIFLVGHNASSDTAQVTFEVKGNDKVESSTAGSALSAVLAVAQVAGAPAPLVTRLSKESSRTLATSIDSAIDSLFAMKLAETQTIDGSIRAWRPVTVTLRIPRRAGGWQDVDQPPSQDGRRRPPPRSSNLDYVPVGSWTVRFEAPHLSAFATTAVVCSSEDTCAATYATQRAKVLASMTSHYGEVLTFPLIRDADEIGTIGSYLRQLDWWAGASIGLDSNKPDSATFCRHIRDAMTDLGFSRLDADFTVKAVAQSALISVPAGKLVDADPDCAIR